MPLSFIYIFIYMYKYLPTDFIYMINKYICDRGGTAHARLDIPFGCIVVALRGSGGQTCIDYSEEGYVLTNARLLLIGRKSNGWFSKGFV